MAAFQFYLQSRKQRKLRLMGTPVMFLLGKIFPGEEESVKWCVAVMQKPILLSPNFGAKS
jgi:hypothetical protein